MGMSGLLGLDHAYKFRFKNGEWVRVNWFPQVKIEIWDAGSDWVHAVRHDGKKFTAPNSTYAIQDALDDWAKVKLRLSGDLPLLRP